MRPTNNKRIHERPARHIRGAAKRLVVKRAVDVARHRPTMRSVLAPETLARWAPPAPQEDGPAEDRHTWPSPFKNTRIAFSAKFTTKKLKPPMRYDHF